MIDTNGQSADRHGDRVRWGTETKVKRWKRGQGRDKISITARQDKTSRVGSSEKKAREKGASDISIGPSGGNKLQTARLKDRTRPGLGRERADGGRVHRPAIDRKRIPRACFLLRLRLLFLLLFAHMSFKPILSPFQDSPIGWLES